MQAISTIRCPSLGSSPVVSVSRTISRINPPAPFSVDAPSLASYRRFFGTQESDDCLQPAQAQGSAPTCRNDEVGAPAFFESRSLIAQDRRQSALSHTGPPQYSLLLHEPRC